MSDGTVLRLLVATRGLQPEPVATAALAQILAAPAAASALSALAADMRPGLPVTPALRWSGQVTSETDPGRPDLEGLTARAPGWWSRRSLTRT